jgi:hypothetical protein
MGYSHSIEEIAALITESVEPADPEELLLDSLYGIRHAIELITSSEDAQELKAGTDYFVTQWSELQSISDLYPQLRTVSDALEPLTSVVAEVSRVSPKYFKAIDNLNAAEAMHIRAERASEIAGHHRDIMMTRVNKWYKIMDKKIATLEPKFYPES